MRKGRTVLEAKRYGIYSCSRQMTLMDAAREILERDVSALVVVEEDGALAGVISRTDLLRACTEREDWPVQSVAAYMSQDVVTVSPQTPLCEVADLLLQNHIHRVIVVRTEGDKARPVAVVSDGDFIYHMVKDGAE